MTNKTLLVETAEIQEDYSILIQIPTDKSIKTIREKQIVELCKQTPNDMELGRKLRDYINQNFK